MQVRNLIAQRFAIQLARREGVRDGVGERHHLLEKRGSLRGGELVQLGGMDARHQDAIAGVVLPGTEQGDGMRELPDELVGWQFAQLSCRAGMVRP